jgi:hypothetical protein
MPIYLFLDKQLNLYSKYRPKDQKMWVIPPHVQKEVVTTRKYKLKQQLQRLTYTTLQVKGVYESELKCPSVKIAQIKSKFNSMRFYIDGGDNTVYGMIQFAEYLCRQATEASKGTKI